MQVIVDVDQSIVIDSHVSCFLIDSRVSVFINKHSYFTEPAMYLFLTNKYSYFTISGNMRVHGSHGQPGN